MASSTARAASPTNAGDPPASAGRRHLEDPLCAAVVEAQVEALLAVGTRDDVPRHELIKRAGYRRFRRGGGGIGGVAKHAFGGGLEFLGDPFEMQLAYKELGQGLRKFAMRNPVSGHAQPVERIGPRHVIPERLQNALEGLHAG